MKGWVSLWRKIFENPIVPPAKVFSKFEAWVWLLVNVNHSVGKVVIGTEIVNVPVGSRITSIKKLCRTFGWGNTKVRNFLKLLSNDGMIEYKSNTQYTTVSICNYSTYQSSQHTRKSQTTRKQTTSKSKAHTNNNDRIMKKNEYNDEFVEFWNMYPKKVGKKYALKSWLKLDSQEQKRVMLTLPKQKKNWASDGTEMQFIPNPATWLNQGRFDDEVSGKSLQEQNAERSEILRKKREYENAVELDKQFKEGDEETPESIRRVINQWLRSKDD